MCDQHNFHVYLCVSESLDEMRAVLIKDFADIK